MEPLTGQELLSFIQEHPDLPKDELMEATGYFSEKPDGTKSLKFMDFYQNLIEAKGISIAPAKSGRGRTLPYTASVQKNGNIILGAGYITKYGFSPGDAFKIDAQPGSIRLIPSKTEE